MTEAQAGELLLTDRLAAPIEKPATRSRIAGLVFDLTVFAVVIAVFA